MGATRMLELLQHLICIHCWKKASKPAESCLFCVHHSSISLSLSLHSFYFSSPFFPLHPFVQVLASVVSQACVFSLPANKKIGMERCAAHRTITPLSKWRHIKPSTVYYSTSFIRLIFQLVDASLRFPASLVPCHSLMWTLTASVRSHLSFLPPPPLSLALFPAHEVLASAQLILLLCYNSSEAAQNSNFWTEHTHTHVHEDGSW